MNPSSSTSTVINAQTNKQNNTAAAQRPQQRYLPVFMTAISCFFVALFVFAQVLKAPTNNNLLNRQVYNMESTQFSSNSVRSLQQRQRQVQDHEEQTLNPKMIWLMSFPNSGTSFTITLIRRITNRTTATNYADEVTAPGYPSLPIYDGPSYEKEGPFWYGINSTMTEFQRSLPDKFVLTKTHCGSRCINCGPSKYIETSEEFLQECCKGHARLQEQGSKKIPYVDVWYPSSRIHKAVHIIRNPLHNIISRFHLDWKNHMHSNKTDWLHKYPNNKVGFQNWCAAMNKKSKHDEKVTLGADIYDLLKHVPCHGEFYRYTQWHNLAFDVVQTKLADNIPSLVIHYEDYDHKFNETVDTLLNFIELEREGNSIKQFHATKSSVYDAYYNTEQIGKIKKLIQKISTIDTWKQLQHYFFEESAVEEDDEKEINELE